MSAETVVPPAAPAAPAPPTSFGDALNQALGDSILPPSAAVPTNRRAAEVVPQTPAAPEAVTPAPEVVTPAAPAAEVVTPAAPAEPVDPNDPFAALKQATAAYQKPEEPVTPAEPEVTLPDNADEKQKTAFATIVSKLKDAQAKVQKYEAQEAANTASGTKDAELQVKLENITKERDEYARHMEIVRFESTPKFQSEVVKPMQAIGAQLQALATQNKAGTGGILEALQKTDVVERRAALKEVTKEWDPVDALEARTAVEHLVQLHGHRTELLANAKQNYESYMEQQNAEIKQKQDRFATDATKAFEEMWPQFQKAMPFLASRPDDPAWNAHLDEIKQAAIKLDSEPMTHARRAAMTYQAVSLPVVVNALTQIGEGIIKENKALKERVKNLEAAQPGGGRPTGDLDTGLPSTVGFLEAFETKLSAKGIK